MPANDIESEAANWLIRLEGDPSPQMRANFDAWLAADPRNQAAFIRLEQTWSRADILNRLRPLDGAVDELVVDKFGVPTPLFDAPKKRPRNPLLAVAATFLIVAVGAITWIVVSRAGWQVYETEFGGFQRVALPDGSIAMLNTDSRMRARMSSGRREIVLDWMRVDEVTNPGQPPPDWPQGRRDSDDRSIAHFAEAAASRPVAAPPPSSDERSNN